MDDGKIECRLHHDHFFKEKNQQIILENDVKVLENKYLDF